MFAGPFITIHGNPLLLLNIVERKFVVLGQIFWPQDMIIFAIAMLVVSHRHHHFHRRLWPALVRLGLSADGDDGNGLPQNRIPHRRRRAPAARLEQGAVERRENLQESFPSTCIFFALSFLVGNVLLSYIIGWQAALSDHHRPAGAARRRAGVHDRVRAVVLRHLCAVPRTGLHVHLPLWPLSIRVAR